MDADPARPEQASFLRRRNALWAELRAQEVGSPEFETSLAALMALIHWPRERVLAGLGLSAGSQFPSEGQDPRR
jgi:hypothetical protein